MGQSHGLWAYEYALHNLNSHRSVYSFMVPKHSSTSLSNIGFHDVDYHSGEAVDGTDWPYDAQNDSITWATSTWTSGNDATANALRWGTLYNFRFQADAAPAANDGNITLGLWRAGPPGSPTSITVETKVPCGGGSCQSGGDCCAGQVCCNSQCISGECCTNLDCLSCDVCSGNVCVSLELVCSPKPDPVVMRVPLAR